MNPIYNTSAEVQKDLQGSSYGKITKLAGCTKSEHVKMYPDLPNDLNDLRTFYIGIGFLVTEQSNYLKLESNYPFIQFRNGDLLVIHFSTMEAIEITLNEIARSEGEITTTMVSISDNQLLYLNDTDVAHTYYFDKRNKYPVNCHFSKEYNCQYENKAEGAELLKIAAMRIVATKLIMIYQSQNVPEPELIQYSLVK